MYEPFFGLHDSPFSLTPDPRRLWLSQTHEEGLATLCYGITRRKGFLLLTGEVGVGKTTLLRAALEAIPEDVETALVFHTAGLTGSELLQLIAADLRIEVPGDSRIDCLLAIQARLLERLRAGQSTVLIIDEAQNLAVSVLEEVRLLSNLETDTQKLFQIVLTGQPELLEKLASPALRALRQRIALEHHVEPLRLDEIQPYLRHRIEVAGGRFEDVFAPGVAPAFFAFSGGSPRLLNVLADRVLLAAYAKQLRPVPPWLVQERAEALTAARGGRPGLEA